MLQWLTDILHAFFEQAEIAPESVTEIELGQGHSPWVWYLHLTPEQPWFAEVNKCTGEWGVVLHDSLTA